MRNGKIVVVDAASSKTITDAKTGIKKRIRMKGFQVNQIGPNGEPLNHSEFLQSKENVIKNVKAAARIFGRRYAADLKKVKVVDKTDNKIMKGWV